MLTRSLTLLAIMLASIIASCGGTATPPAADGSHATAEPLQDLPAQWQDQLPPLPDPRSASGSFVSERVGSNYLAKSGNAIEDGNRLDLLSGSNSISWACWQYTGGPRVVTSLEFVMDVPADNEYYVAVPDYRSGRWQFRGPFDSGRVFRADSFDFYSPGGDFYALALTAGGNKASVAAVNATTADNWQCVEIRPELAQNSQPFVELVDGKPVVLFFDRDSQSYRILSSSTQYGEDPGDWSEKIFLLVGEDFIRYTDLAIINGKPAITFSNGDNRDLNYFREGMDDYITITGDLNASGGRNSLLEVEGHAAIAYRDGSAGDLAAGALMYVRSSTPNGLQVEDWDGKHTIYGASSGFDKPDMAIVDGRPAIACFDYAFENVMYMWCDDSLGETPGNWHNRVLHLSNGNPEFINLVVAGGVPAVCFYDDWNDTELWYAYATVPAPGAEPGDWEDPFVVDTNGQAGYGASMSTFNGRPFIAYYNDNGNVLRYALPKTLNGVESGWSWSPLVDEGNGSSSLNCQAFSIDGRMIVCYTDYDSGAEGNKSIRWCWREAGSFE